MKASRGNSLKKWLPIAVLAAGLGAFFALGGDRYVSFSALAEHRNQLVDWVATWPIVTRLVFALIYIVTVAFSLPIGSLLTVAGGLMFGLIEGTALVVVAATFGATLVYWVAKTSFGTFLREKAGPFLARVEGGFNENALSYLLVLRLVPIFPFWLVNIVPGLLNVPVRTYILATLVGIIPGTFAFVSVGNGLGAVVEQGKAPGLEVLAQPEVLIPIVALSLVSLIPIAYKRFKAS